MRLLLERDSMDYDPNGRALVRPSRANRKRGHGPRDRRMPEREARVAEESKKTILQKCP